MARTRRSWRRRWRRRRRRRRGRGGSSGSRSGCGTAGTCQAGQRIATAALRAPGLHNGRSDLRSWFRNCRQPLDTACRVSAAAARPADGCAAHLSSLASSISSAVSKLCSFLRRASASTARRAVRRDALVNALHGALSLCGETVQQVRCIDHKAVYLRKARTHRASVSSHARMTRRSSTDAPEPRAAAWLRSSAPLSQQLRAFAAAPASSRVGKRAPSVANKLRRRVWRSARVSPAPAATPPVCTPAGGARA